ncbi:hypothetical protein LINGRAHAP2_LOCUS8994 [Linum grandiflorum]
MPPFAFRSNNHFVASSDGIILQVYELTKPTNHLSSIKKADWKEVATIHKNLEDNDDDDDGDVDPKSVSYDGLMFFDGHGTIEGEEEITTLAKHLKELHLLVSPEGYCFQQVFDLGVYSDFGIQYIRWNDLFSWPGHGVGLATTNVWSRLELKYNLPKKKNTSKRPDVGDHVGVSKEKYAKLEMLVKEKEEELEKLKEANEEHRKQLRKKKESEEANTKRIEQLEKLNEELEEANKAKDEEVEKLKRKKVNELEVKTKKIEELEKINEESNEAKREELQELKKKMKRGEEAKTKRIEELEKLKEELEDSIEAKDEELKKKEAELRVLQHKRDDDEDEKRKVEAELKEVRKKLSSSVAEVKKELEECQRKSWAILPSTKFLPPSLEAKEKYLTTRKSVPPETFSCNSGVSFPFVQNSRKLVDKMQGDCGYNVRLVDEESCPSKWPPLPNVQVWVRNGDADFDKNNWWYLKTTHPEGGLTMLVYYEGNRSQISHGDNRGDPIIPLPFSKDIPEVYTYVHRFSLFLMEPFGMRYGFAYRPR